jgi:hypothetical protein
MRSLCRAALIAGDLRARIPSIRAWLRAFTFASVVPRCDVAGDEEGGYDEDEDGEGEEDDEEGVEEVDE